MPERLELVSKPSATLVRFEEQKPLLPDGVTIERFSTSGGRIYERHSTAAGAVTWYRVFRTPGTAPAKEVK